LYSGPELWYSEGMAPTTDEKLDALLGAVAQLTTVVGALAQTVAVQPDPAASAPAPDTALPVMTLDDGYADLVYMNEENIHRRTRLAVVLGIHGTEPGRELVEHGARGFYRRLEREEGQERLQFRRDHARMLVEDALLEDPKEAADMGADLLKVWDQDEVETFMARGGVDVEMKGGGS